MAYTISGDTLEELLAAAELVVGATPSGSLEWAVQALEALDPQTVEQAALNGSDMAPHAVTAHIIGQCIQAVAGG